MLNQYFANSSLYIYAFTLSKIDILFVIFVYHQLLKLTFTIIPLKAAIPSLIKKIHASFYRANVLKLFLTMHSFVQISVLTYPF